MKGGAYLSADRLQACGATGLAKLPLTYLFTPDEEIGSPSTPRTIIEEEARHAPPMCWSPSPPATAAKL